MKILICLVFFINYSYCDFPSYFQDSVWNGYNYYPEKLGPVSDDGVKKESKSDEYEVIVKPCSIQDRECIRNHLAPISGCTPSFGSPRDSSFVQKLPLILPSANTSVILYDAELRGISSGDIKEFFINKKSGVLVLEVQFDSIMVYSPKAVFILYRKGDEPVKSVDKFSIEFKLVTLTLVVEGSHFGYVGDSHVSASIPTPINLQIQAGSEIRNSQALKEIQTVDVDLTAKEALVTIGQVYMAAYLQNKICYNEQHYKIKSFDLN